MALETMHVSMARRAFSWSFDIKGSFMRIPLPN
jgi:hypothetical protein